MITNLKVIAKYLFNGIICFFGSFLIVKIARLGLPSSLTHGNIPEIPPTTLSDIIILLVLSGFIFGFSTLLDSVWTNPLSNHGIKSKLWRILNWVSAAFIVFSAIGMSLVVNDGSFSDLMGLCFTVSQILAVLLMLINLGGALKQQRIGWYRYAMGFQLLAIVIFWLGLWISPA
ncbi:hypothetical protein [Lactobacillus sp. Sy-1]|uniref:hypothetical protein n=1 Tax=Lactobacillus sp. Sy-1 TaxID=2109645 RepID=UPI001C5B0E9C|nr:hypothetical protein [Lactobacillus sp. Sy-1]MBW1606054.1 hypothetical protein [Lactobacillus sp. Sy-1]